MCRKVLTLIIIVMCVLIWNEKSVPCQAATSVTVSTFSDLKKYLEDKNEYTITVGNNIEITSKITVVGKKTVYGNGKCLYRGVSYTSNYLIAVADEASLNIVSNAFISGNSDSIKSPAKPLFRVGKNAILILGEKVSVYKSHSNEYGGAIYCEGTLYIKGANIYDCRCNTSGAAVQLASGSKCYMSAGRIYNNSAASNGGAIQQFENSKLVLSGGKIDHNTCLNHGNGIWASGTVVLKDSGMVEESNDIYIVTGGVLNTEDWITPSNIVLTTYPEVGKEIVLVGSSYKSYFRWSDKQSMSKERPICADGTNLVVGAYYSIKYYQGADNKNLYATQTKTYGSPITLLSKGPELAGYTFVGWYTSSVNGESVTGTRYYNNASANFYAQYSANFYEVSFQSENQTLSRRQYQYNTVYGQLPIITRDGFSLVGWYLDSDCTKLVEEGSLVSTPRAHTLYARWAANECQVSFDATGGEVEIKEKHVVYKEKYGDLPVPTRLGYEFAGWYTEPKGGLLLDETSDVAAFSDHTLYARWKGCAYYVDWDPMGGGISFEKSSVIFGERYQLVPKVQKEGYTLDGWYTQPIGGIKYGVDSVVDIPGDHILYARWIPINNNEAGNGTSGESTKQPVITIKSISVIGLLCYYKENQSINTKGMKLQIVYSNDSKKTITSGYSIDSYKKSAGKRNVVFRYQGKSCVVTCTWLSSASIAKIKPSKSSYTGYVGNKLKLSLASSTYKDKLKVTYKSSNTKIVKVSSTGTLQLVKKGTAYIYVSICLGNITKTVKVKVVVKEPTLSTSFTYKKQWNQVQFKASAKGITSKPVYKSSNTKIARIDSKTGKFSALKSGTITITIKVGKLQKKYSVKISTKYKYIVIR